MMTIGSNSKFTFNKEVIDINHLRNFKSNFRIYYESYVSLGDMLLIIFLRNVSND